MREIDCRSIQALGAQFMARKARLSLAQAQPGQVLEVHKILFDIVRGYIGLSEDELSEAIEHGLEVGEADLAIEGLGGRLAPAAWDTRCVRIT